jgi:hypothetical protein
MILTNGGVIVERLLTKEDSSRTLKYELISGMSVSTMTGTLKVVPGNKGSKLIWRVKYLPAGKGAIFVGQEINTWLDAGMASLSNIQTKN